MDTTTTEFTSLEFNPVEYRQKRMHSQMSLGVCVCVTHDTLRTLNTIFEFVVFIQCV